MDFLEAMDATQGDARADRAVRAYAYLTASFRAGNQVNDVLDCIVPFVAKVALRDQTQPVVVADIASALEGFGLKIPLYAVQQLLPRLQKRGLLEWSAVAKAYIPVAAKIIDQTSDIDLNSDFQSLEGRIALFASSLELPSVPFSNSWTDALIRFLHSERVRGGVKSITLKKALISEYSEIENFIIARFIQSASTNDRSAFDQIARVYSGILIEDFVNNVQSIGNVKDYKGLNVLYDTPVLLRLLGCSGRSLQTATLEMHDNLKELGCNLYYFDINRSEATNILDAILSANAYGNEIFGETGEAIINGEVDIPWIRDLVATFEIRLGQMNVFPFDYDYKARKAEDNFQIDEIDFTEALVSAALKSDRAYKRENALNDAKSVALAIRLRKGKISRDLAQCRYIFVSGNSLLQRTARKFCIQHLQEYDESATGPVITLGQITTAGWLATERALEPHKVSQELLSNCYSAVRPSPAWAEEFAKAVEKFSEEDKSAIAERADAALILKATRDAVRDESLNEAAVLRKINVAEIFRQARKAADEAERERITALQAIELGHVSSLTLKIEDTLREQEAIRLQAVAEALEIERNRLTKTHVDGKISRNRERSDRISSDIVKFFQIGLIAILIILAIMDKFNPLDPESLIAKIMSWIIIVVAIIGALDLGGARPIGKLLDKLRSKLASRIYVFLQDENRV